MLTKEIVVKNSSGIHARPAAQFVQAAGRFKSQITVSKDGRSGNAKSLLALLSMGINKGSSIAITAEGEDEAAAVKTLVELVEAGFGEA